MPIRYAIWAAVSTREQARADKFSIPSQLSRTAAEAEARGWLQSAGPFVVEGQSRTKYIQLDQASRDIEPLRLMLQSARARQFDVLIMTEFDRMRELLDQVFRTLASYRIQLYSLAQPIEPVPPDEYNIYKADTIAMMIGMSGIASRMEISRTRRKWIENMPKRITELGLPVHIPYGYRKPVGHETDRKAVPEPDPTIVPHLIKIKDMLLEGHSTTQLADYLSKSLLSPPRGKKWHSQTIRDILRNPFYTGIVRIGVSRVYLDPTTATRKRDRDIPPDKIQTAQGRHLPLWDEATLHAINLELKRRTKNYRGRKNNQFTGLVKCGVCGAPMWRQGNGPRAYRLIWRCSKCTTSIPHEILLQKVGEALSSKIASVGVTHSHPTQQPNLPTWSAKLKDLRTRQDRLEEAYLAGQWDLDRYTKRKAELDYQVRDALDEIKNAERQKAERRSWTESITTLANQNDIPHWLIHTDPNEVNRDLRILLTQITIFTDTIELVFI